MGKYKIRLDRRNRKPLPQCRLTQEEWKLYLDQLNTAVESEDEERIYQAKNLVKNEIREIYIDRYERDGEYVLCGEKAGYFGLCKKCWRSLMGNAILRAEGHTKAEHEKNHGKPCVVCGSEEILCRQVCPKCYGLMRTHGFTTTKQLMEYKAEKAEKAKSRKFRWRE